MIVSRIYRDSGDRGDRGGRTRDNDRSFGGERRNYNDREPRSYGDRGGNRNFDGDRGGNRNFDGDRGGDRGGNRNFDGDRGGNRNFSRDRSPTRYNDREPRSYRDSGDRGDRGGRRYSPTRDTRGSREYRGGGSGGSGGRNSFFRDNGDRGRSFSSNRNRYNDGGAPRSDSPPAPAARGGSESPSKNEPTFDTLPKRDDDEY